MDALKNLLALTALIVHLGGAAWLWTGEGWQSALAWFIVFPILAGVLLMVHDAVSRLFSSPGSRAPRS